jgi:hypothetical protein
MARNPGQQGIGELHRSNIAGIEAAAHVCNGQVV